MKTFFLMMAICSIVLAPGAEFAVAAAVDVPDTMAERVKPCVACHGSEGVAGKDSFY